MGGGMMNGGFGNYWWMGGSIGLLINLAIIVGIVLLVVWMVQKLSRPTYPNTFASSLGPSQTMSAREVLDVRYTKGELTREQYQTMLADISPRP